MSIISAIKGWWNRMFSNAVKKNFGVSGIESKSMKDAIKTWLNVYQGNAPWVDPVEDIKSIGFAQKICATIAELTTLDIDVQFDGKRKEYMQQFYNSSVAPKLREWVEFGCACGSIILKPNGEGVDFVTPDRFEIIQKDGNHNITDIVFQDSYEQDGKYYTKLERHRFWDADVRMPDSEEYTRMTYYTIENKAFVSKVSTEIGVPVNLTDTKWLKLQPEVHITKKNDEKLNSMLFGFFKMPGANNIDLDSPLGLSAFDKALEELKDLDVAYSRNSTEIFDSKRIVLVDERLVQMPSTKDSKGNIVRNRLHLPKFAKNVNADDQNSFYQEINPQINIEQRKQEIDFQLSLIGCKCGFSNGYFVLDEKTGMVTATQVEADDRETIQLIKDTRDKLKICLEDLFYAQSVFADLYGLAPVGEYKINYDFGDITFNAEEDRARALQLANSGYFPKWYYLVHWEGFSEEEAKAMVEEAQPKEEGLFSEE